jgi:hypothetical protein
LHDKYDDKELTDNMLRETGRFTLPKYWAIANNNELESLLASKSLPLPIVAKPIHGGEGAGGYGVKECQTYSSLSAHSQELFDEGAVVMLEQFLTGEEVTITVMPPTPSRAHYWALPLVTRFNHKDGIAPFSGNVAVTANSRALAKSEEDADPAYSKIARECEGVAEFLS